MLRYILVFQLLLPMLLVAQGHERKETVDSLNQRRVDGGIPYALRPVDSLLYAYAYTNKVWIGDIPKGFSFVRLGADLRDGTNIPAKGATKSRQLAFDAEGAQHWGGSTFWGKFSYKRQQEDSTRLRHQTRLNPDAPLYFGSLKNNHYDREMYEINTAVQRPLANGKLPVTLGADYRLGNHYANNDPRGRIADFLLDFSLGLGYNRPKTTLHLQGHYGYGRERASVGFKNDKYTSNVADSLYVNWRMLGYGYAQRWINNMDYTNDRKRHGLRFYARQQIGGDQYIYLNVGGLREEQFFVLYNSSLELTYEPLVRYERTSYGGDVQWHRSNLGQPGASLLVGLGGELVDGDDYNHILAVNNYQYRKKQARIWSAYQSDRYLARLNLDYVDEHKSDASAAQSFAYGQFGGQLELGRFFNSSERGKWLATATVHLVKNTDLTHHFITANLGNMALTTVHHDALYYGSDQLGFSARVEYVHAARQSPSWRIGLRGENMRRLNRQSPPYTPYSVPGRKRNGLELYMYLYL